MSTAPGTTRIVDLCGADKGYQLMQTAKQSITFSVNGGAGTGDSAVNKELFIVTGTVLAAVLAVCSVSLEGGGATIELGTSESTAELAAALTCTDFDAGMLWVTGDKDTEVDFATMVWIIVDDVDIGYNIDVADVTAGAVDFYCFWVPISDNGNVEAAGSNVAL